MKGPEFDAMLRDALLESQRERWGETAQEGPELVWTTKRRQHMDRMLADPSGYGKRRSRPAWRRALSHCAQAAAFLLMAGAVILTVSPSARTWAAGVVQMTTEWWSDRALFIFEGKYVDEAVNEVWRPTELPEGYVLTEVTDFRNAWSVIYTNGEGKRISLDYVSVTQGHMFDMDNEHSDYSTTYMNGQVAYVFDSNTEGKHSCIIWFNEEGTIGFQLLGIMPAQDLWKIARSVEIIEE